MLVVCEEAHRYVPADPPILASSRHARRSPALPRRAANTASRSAVITQRPGELDQTILSQCSTLFAMPWPTIATRKSSPLGHPDSSISTTSFISSIAMAKPSLSAKRSRCRCRMRFTRVEEQRLPKANGVNAKSTRRRRTPSTCALHRQPHACHRRPDISAFPEQFENSLARAMCRWHRTASTMTRNSMTTPWRRRHSTALCPSPCHGPTPLRVTEQPPLRQSLTSAQTPTIEPYRAGYATPSGAGDVVRRTEAESAFESERQQVPLAPPPFAAKAAVRPCARVS